MELFKKTSMSWDHKNYEIRVLYDERKINIVAFHNHHPANGFRHKIELPKLCDVHGILEHDTVKEMIEISKNEIIEHKWEKLVASLQEYVANK